MLEELKCLTDIAFGEARQSIEGTRRTVTQNGRSGAAFVLISINIDVALGGALTLLARGVSRFARLRRVDA